MGDAWAWGDVHGRCCTASPEQKHLYQILPARNSGRRTRGVPLAAVASLLGALCAGLRPVLRTGAAGEAAVRLSRRRWRGGHVDDDAGRAAGLALPAALLLAPLLGLQAAARDVRACALACSGRVGGGEGEAGCHSSCHSKAGRGGSRRGVRAAASARRGGAPPGCTTRSSCTGLSGASGRCCGTAAAVCSGSRASSASLAFLRSAASAAAASAGARWRQGRARRPGGAGLVGQRAPRRSHQELTCRCSRRPAPRCRPPPGPR
jgi:hypothetical protein